MRRFRPEYFTQLARLLGFTEDLDRWTSSLNNALRQATTESQIFTRARHSRSGEVDDEFRKQVLIVVKPFLGTCLDLGLTASAVTIRKMIALLEDANTVTEAALAELSKELQGRLHDEMSQCLFFSLTPKEAEFYKSPREDWDLVISRFPGAAGDVEEATKCIAVSRYAASVFHSVQVVEMGLIELGTFIKVSDPHSGWTAVANRLKKIVDTKYADRSAFERENFAFLEQLHGTVEALKNAWRNKISHAHSKLVLLTTDFSPEIAEEILYATRAFMRRLADGLQNCVS